MMNNFLWLGAGLAAGLVVLGFTFTYSTALTSPKAPTYDHLAIMVRDLERAADFYVNVLGLPEIEDQTGKDHIRWFGLGPHLALHIIQSPEADSLNHLKGAHLALTVADLPAMMRKLRKQGIAFEDWAGQANVSNLRPDSVAQIYFQDPDGYWLEINDAIRPKRNKD
ncbi:MAG: VOC family protein [Lewinella sp.]|nr:VOC family protein [Lewinella sp.]